MFKRSYVKDAYPLSPMQEGMLFYFLLNRESGDHFKQVSYTIKGDIKPALFQEAFQQLVQRYDILRTIFIYEGVKKPLQVVLKKKKATIIYEDISSLNEEERKIFIKNFKKEDKAKGFDLSKDILMRYSILKTSGNGYEVIVIHHHIIMDGWCSSILLKELLYIYNNLVNGVEPPQLQTPVPYGIFIKWLEKQDVQEGLNYWRAYLGNFENRTVLPKLKESKDKKLQQAQYTFVINTELTEELNKISRSNKSTINTCFQTLWGILLQKYNNTRDVVFGSVVSGRPSEIPRIEMMLGLFINTIPIRIQSEEGDTFVDLLKKNQDKMLASNKYEYVPLVDIQSNSKLKRGLFSHIIAFDNFPADRGMDNLRSNREGEFSVQAVDYYEQTNYDFAITVVPRKDLYVIFRYNANVFDEIIIKRAGEHLIQIIRKVIENPEIRIEKIELLSESEKKELLVEFNDTKSEYPRDKTIHELFELQVEKTPENISLVDIDGTEETYRELNKKANQLAKSLRNKGVRTGSIVGIMLERSVEMIIALLGILKSGGAYLPIDPDYPVDRIAYMLLDSSARGLITTSTLATEENRLKSLEICSNLEITHIDSMEFSDFSDSQLVSSPTSSPSDLAYIIYTSGTSGKPKGTMIRHFSLVNRLSWMQKCYPIDENDTILQKTTITFDVSVWELFWWSIQGAKLSLLIPGGQKDPEVIVDTIKKNNVTVIHFVPSMLNAFLEYVNFSGNIEKISTLKQVFASGEALTPHLVKTFNDLLNKHNSTKLANLYGPTEATIDVSYFNCSTGEEFKKIPIGKPIDNINLFVINEDKQLQPIGVWGELCISGDGLAPGYLNRPELTIEKFIPLSAIGKAPSVSGYSAIPQMTNEFYRTGDLARLLSDGNIEFLGRMDHQVKIRGARIELGEIENCFLKNENIKEVFITSGDEHNEEKSIYTYYVSDKEFTVSELKKFLGKDLPDYMIPSHFIKLKRIPLTPNGKIDRKSLPKPDGDIEIGIEYIAPKDEVEKKLAKIWMDLLNLKKVGIKDNFFNVGGDSIKIIRLVSMINSRLNVYLKLIDIYHNNTIEKLAEKIRRSKTVDRRRKQEFQEILREIEEQKTRIMKKSEMSKDIVDVYPMSDIEKGMTYHFLKDRNIYFHQDVYQLKFRNFDVEKIKKSMSLLIEKHPMLRTSFNLEESVQIIHKSVPPNVTYNDISGMGKSEQREYIKNYIFESRRKSFDVETPPLYRLNFFNLGNDSLFLVWEYLHAILDGWSVNSFMVELNNTVIQLESNPDFIPRKLKHSYKDFVVEHLAEKKRDEIKEFWKNELTDFKRLVYPQVNARQEFRNIYIDLSLPLMERLQMTAQKYNTSLKHLCFAAYAFMLSMLSFENDFVVGLATNNRPGIEDGEKILGCFLNTVPVRLKIPANIRWKDYIRLIEDKMLQIKKYDGFSLSEIKKVIGEETMYKNPLFDDTFDFLDFHIRREFNPKDIEADSEYQNFDDEILREGHTLSNELFGLTINLTLRRFLVIVNYSTALLSHEDVEKLISYFKQVLNNFVSHPEEKISKTGMISGNEREKILYEFNKTTVEFPIDRTVVRLFEEQVEKRPDNIAGVKIPLSVTYKELNRRANQLAHVLIGKGVTANSIVGIMAEPSIEMIVGIISILKAGGAYLPIEPEYPGERITHILLDSSADILLKQKRLPARFPGSMPDIEMIDIDGAREIEKDSMNPESTIRLDDLVYIIYTSGSTGRPKGVMLDHGNLIGYLYSFYREFEITSNSIVIQQASFSFDAFVEEVYSVLLKGGRIAIPSKNEIFDIDLLSKFILKSNVNLISCSPLLLNELNKRNTKNSISTYISGGDVLKKGYIDSLIKSGDVYNTYGPTETTVCATYYKCSNEGPSNIPIGKPISNYRVYILDNHNELIPIGVAGELCVSGIGLARGYLNRQELTVSKYETNHFNRKERLYRSGDIARWLPDGNIEFLGRIDSQVKIRGYRVELGEIEYQLMNVDEIKEVIVIVKEQIRRIPGWTIEESDSNRHLCAYIVANSGLNDSALREYLSGKLPSYMIPTYFIPLEKLPTTPNGKIDKKKLELSELSVRDGYLAPQDDMEEQLAAIWSEVLGVKKEKIGIESDFFQLGGHSLKTTKMAAKIHKKFNVSVPFIEVFKKPTIRQLAKYIKSKSNKT